MQAAYRPFTLEIKPLKRAALYMRVSTIDQHPQNQLNELRNFAQQRGFEIAEEYTDRGVSGTKARRPALDKMLKDAHRHKFDVVVVWACDRLARSTKHFLQVLDELNDLGIQFLSQREAIDTDGPLGRAIVVIVSAVAELERSLIVERVRAGMRRAKLDGRRIGRAPLDVDHAALVRDRLTGMSLTHVAKKYGLSRASVVRFVQQAQARHGGADDLNFSDTVCFGTGTGK
jgi:DNA invertase Pin-like site-specific DNA recombinase